MLQLPEHFLQFAWREQRFDQNGLCTSDGRSLLIVSVGEHNQHSGADFSYAKIFIDGLLWAGDVEIHWRSSDWNKHQHQHNPAYNSVILHVVYQHDAPILNQRGEVLPTLVLEGRIEPTLVQNYAYLLSQQHFIPCYKQFYAHKDKILPDWLDYLTLRRLQRKSERILAQLRQSHNNYEQIFYQCIARALGGEVNGEAMEQLAQACPLLILQKNRNLFQIESLLLGQAGLIPAHSEDTTVQKLLKEYQYLAQKYDLQPLNPQIWTFMRLRPAHFPSLRIAQLAQLVFQSQHLCATLLNLREVKDIYLFLGIKLATFWDNRYTLDKTSSAQPKSLGKSSINSLIINTIAPFLHAYAQASQEADYTSRAIHILQQLAPENNSIIAEWSQLGVSPRNAAQTQALLELKKAYCEPKNCLNCAVGRDILAIN